MYSLTRWEQMQSINSQNEHLTYRGLVTPYGDMDLGLHSLR